LKRLEVEGDRPVVGSIVQAQGFITMSIRFSLNNAVKTAVFGAALALTGNAAMAADVVTQVQNFGTLSAPYSTFYGHTFTPANQPSAADTFYDDYAFTVDAGAFSSISATFDLGSLLQISNLSARLFTGTPWSGSTPGTLNPADLLQRWSNVVASGTGSGSVQSINPIALNQGSYVLEVRGNVTGSSGGSYGGVFNLAPVPEPTGIALAFVGLGFLGFVARRRKN
jgi:hypothetical protein